MMVRRDLIFVAAVVVASNVVAAVVAVWATRARQPEQAADVASDAKLDSILNALQADSINPVVVSGELSPAVAEIVAALQADHARILGSIGTSTAQRNQDMDRLIDLTELVACNTSEPKHRYTFC